MWEELHKDPLDISPFLPTITEKEYSMMKFLRLEMDRTGMDPTKGKVVHIESLRKQLPRYFHAWDIITMKVHGFFLQNPNDWTLARSC